MVKKKAKATIPEKEVRYLKQIFDEYDGDGSGTIEQTELGRTLKQSSNHSLLNLSADMFWHIDADGDGKITFLELLRSLYPRMLPSRVEAAYRLVCPEDETKEPKPRVLTEEQVAELEAIFYVYDTDGSGNIETAELIEAVSGCGYDRDELLEMFSKHDKDQSGSLDVEEFTEMMRESYK